MAVNGKEYEILKLLGKGKGGYSYLASDGKQKYVLKQIHHEPCDYYQFGNKIEAEINDYNRLKKNRDKNSCHVRCRYKTRAHFKRVY